MVTQDAPKYPTRERVYQNHHLDSTRWDTVRLRDDDIVISTSYKAGTTWMQTIVANLLYPSGDIPGAITEISAWVDMRVEPLADVLAGIEAQTHRRFLKTHLALDGLPYTRNVKYIVVGRDPRDVFMSLYNHYSNHTPEMHVRINEVPGRVGPPLPHCPQDINWLWRQWISFGWFAWENDGWPYWSHLHHAKAWWAHRHLPNILFVHYNDLKTDLEGEIRRVAEYLGIDVPLRDWPRVVDAATFTTMKKNAEAIMPSGGDSFIGGARQFIYKGTNERWRGVLSEAELALYPLAMERTLTPEAAAWLERGRFRGHHP